MNAALPQRRGKAALAGLVLAALLAAASAEDINVGGQRNEIPPPRGYTKLLPTMAPYYETMQAYVAPTNIRYVTLIDDAAATKLAGGEFAELIRYMTIETEKGISARTVSSAMFNELRDVLGAQIDDIMAQVNELMPGMIDKGNALLSESLDLDVNLSVGELVPLPEMINSDSVTGYSMYMSVAANVGGEANDAQVVSATMLAVHVKERVLFLYVYGDEADVAWTRSTASQWADAIRAANPAAGDAGAASAVDAPGGFDWGRVVSMAIIGAVIGGLIVLIGSRVRGGSRNHDAN